MAVELQIFGYQARAQSSLLTLGQLVRPGVDFFRRTVEILGI